MNFDFDPNKDYYAILWVSENASQEELKKAFRKLAMQYHPDRAPEDKKKEYEKKFKEINEAYQVLWDENKRRQYDAFRKWGFGWFDFGSFWNFGAGSVFDLGDIFDIFGEFFGWWGGFTRWRKFSKSPRRWEDVIIDLDLTFEEAYKWTKKKIKYKRYIVCPECWWRWVAKDSQKIVCPVCKGKWVIVDVKRTPFGIFQTQRVCDRCWWEGYIDSKPCPKCNGSWRILTEEELTIDIPEGIRSWEILKIPWKWNAWIYGGPYWDLLIKIMFYLILGGKEVDMI